MSGEIYTLTSNYMNGDQEKFEVTPQGLDESTMGGKIRDSLANLMTLAQIARAQRLAKEWLAQHQK